MAFQLTILPWVYSAKYNEHNKWEENFILKEHLSPNEESALTQDEKTELYNSRNSFPEFPLVNYTTQYGMGCFEGAKAYPQKNGGLKLFRPDQNAIRMKNSMEGLMMPGIDEDMLLNGMLEGVSRNRELGFFPEYNSEWEKDNFLTAGSIYIRPFAYSEPGIGVSLSTNPWVIVVMTPVSAYFTTNNKDAVTTDMIRATPRGTGWIKCASNYVIPSLAKKKANLGGFMEAIFLDAYEQKYIEEGSSCNFFALMSDGTLVTPELGDTILPGINRKSVIQLAKDLKINVVERKLEIYEVMNDAKECFVTGTAAGVNPIHSLTHKGIKKDFTKGKAGELTTSLMLELKGIQYGIKEDRHNWMYEVK